MRKEFAVLFDLDGVLVDSEREYTRIWNKINDEFPTGEENFASKIKGTTLEDILSRYYPDNNVRKEVERRLYEEENAMIYRYTPGAKILLERLKSEHIPIALFTSSNVKKMEHLYQDIPEIKDYFDAIVLGDMIKHSKPDPEGYLKAASLLNIPIERCIVVEDSLQGVKAGRASGAIVVGVSGTLPDSILAPYSDRVITTLEGCDFNKLFRELRN